MSLALLGLLGFSSEQGLFTGFGDNNPEDEGEEGEQEEEEDEELKLDSVSELEFARMGPAIVGDHKTSSEELKSFGLSIGKKTQKAN